MIHHLKTTQSQVLLKGIRIFAHHGVLQQERIVGAFFILNLAVDTDFMRAAETDDLTGTISYADLFQVIEEEMAVPSQLLEHVAARICRTILHRFPSANTVRLEILKENPPMGADCYGAGVVLEMNAHE